MCVHEFFFFVYLFQSWFTKRWNENVRTIVYGYVFTYGFTVVCLLVCVWRIVVQCTFHCGCYIFYILYYLLNFVVFCFPDLLKFSEWSSTHTHLHTYTSLSHNHREHIHLQKSSATISLLVHITCCNWPLNAMTLNLLHFQVLVVVATAAAAAVVFGLFVSIMPLFPSRSQSHSYWCSLMNFVRESMWVSATHTHECYVPFRREWKKKSKTTKTPVTNIKKKWSHKMRFSLENKEEEKQKRKTSRIFFPPHKFVTFIALLVNSEKNELETKNKTKWKLKK